VINLTSRSTQPGLTISPRKTRRLLDELMTAGLAFPNAALAEFLVISTVQESIISSETFSKLCNTRILPDFWFFIHEMTGPQNCIIRRAILRLYKDGRQDALSLRLPA
jgi:hypothetical protein